MLETVPKLVFERPRARISRGWVDYHLQGVPGSFQSLQFEPQVPQGGYHGAWRPHFEPKSDPKWTPKQDVDGKRKSSSRCSESPLGAWLEASKATILMILSVIVVP